MGEWKKEEDIKAELRSLTQELKHLREELRDMVTPKPKTKSAGSFLHRDILPKAHPPAPAPLEVAADRPRKGKKKR